MNILEIENFWSTIYKSTHTKTHEVLLTIYVQDLYAKI